MFDIWRYDASKAAVHHLTIKLAAELGPKGISVNAIAPGFVPSKMSSQLLSYASEEAFATMTAIGRIGSPSDMAGAIMYPLHLVYYAKKKKDDSFNISIIESRIMGNRSNHPNRWRAISETSFQFVTIKRKFRKFSRYQAQFVS